MTFPLPGTSLDGATVVASVYSGTDDDCALVILLYRDRPYFAVAEYRLDILSALWREPFENIVPAVRCYEENGGDY